MKEKLQTSFMDDPYYDFIFRWRETTSGNRKNSTEESTNCFIRRGHISFGFQY